MLGMHGLGGFFCGIFFGLENEEINDCSLSCSFLSEVTRAREGGGGRRRSPAGGRTSESAGERFSVTIKDIRMLKSSRKNIDFRNEMKEKSVFNE